MRSIVQRRAASVLLKRSLSTQPAMSIRYPDVPDLKPASAHAKPETKVSTLSNGLRVATEEHYGTVSSLGLFVNAGSKYETFDTHGVSHLLEHMAFKSTDARSHLRLVRDMETIGANVGAASSRECIMLNGECLRGDVGDVLEVLSETLLEPKFPPWDIEHQYQVVGYELEHLENDVPAMLTEHLHAAGYGEYTPYGRSVWCPEGKIEAIDREKLRVFMKQHFQPKNMVLAAANVDHEEFVEAAEELFVRPSNYEDVEAPEVPKVKAEYTGGVKLVEGEAEFTHVALGFNAGSWHSDDLVDICTLHTLLGGGGSFSAGGPGKGMYSRLYLNVLNKLYWADSAIAFNSLYEDTGLFGIYGSCLPQHAGELVDVFASELLALKSGKLTEEEISRAKNQLKSSLLMKLESRQVLCEDIGRQMLSYNKRETPEQICAKVDKVSAASLKKTAEKMLKSKPCLAAFGDVSKVPKLEQVEKRFR